MINFYSFSFLVSPGIQVCESQSKYRVSVAQWVERWHDTPEARVQAGVEIWLFTTCDTWIISVSF